MIAKVLTVDLVFDNIVKLCWAKVDHYSYNTHKNTTVCNIQPISTMPGGGISHQCNLNHRTNGPVNAHLRPEMYTNKFV